MTSPMISRAAIEKAARAICVALGDDPDQLTYAHEMVCTGRDREPMHRWQYWTTHAEAAVSAALALSGWRTIDSAPIDGTRFDAWCVRHLGSLLGVRFTDVCMRGDHTGFGFIEHTAKGGVWHYLETEDDVYPAWYPTHWQPLPAPPATAGKEG